MNPHDMIQTLSKCSIKTVAGMEMTEVTKLLHEQAKQIAELQKENSDLKGYLHTLFKEYKQYWQEHQ